MIIERKEKSWANKEKNTVTTQKPSMFVFTISRSPPCQDFKSWYKMALNIIWNTGPPKNSKYGPTDTKSESSVIPARGIATNNNLNHRPARSRARNILILIFLAGILVGRWFRWQLILTIITHGEILIFYWLKLSGKNIAEIAEILQWSGGFLPHLVPGEVVNTIFR